MCSAHIHRGAIRAHMWLAEAVHRQRPTASRIFSLSNMSLQDDIGLPFSQSLQWGTDTAIR